MSTYSQNAGSRLDSCSSVIELVLVLLAVVMASGCSNQGPRTDSGQRSRGLTLSQEAQIAKDNYLTKDPGLVPFFNHSAGYVIFPSIGKGGLIIGGAYGEGCVYEDGRHIGYAELTQGTIGLQAGGQTFSEVIFFKFPGALQDFKSERFKFAASASAVVLTAGAGATADYENGVAVFVAVKGGLMVEAAIGGQKFSYEPR